MKTPTFKVGDRVRSAPDSCDIRAMKMEWRAVIYKVKPAPNVGAPDDHAYETLGYWSTEKRTKRPTLRQLWSNHLVPWKQDAMEKLREELLKELLEMKRLKMRVPKSVLEKADTGDLSDYDESMSITEYADMLIACA